MSKNGRDFFGLCILFWAELFMYAMIFLIESTDDICS